MLALTRRINVVTMNYRLNKNISYSIKLIVTVVLVGTAAIIVALLCGKKTTGYKSLSEIEPMAFTSSPGEATYYSKSYAFDPEPSDDTIAEYAVTEEQAAEFMCGTDLSALFTERIFNPDHYVKKYNDGTVFSVTLQWTSDNYRVRVIIDPKEDDVLGLLKDAEPALINGSNVYYMASGGGQYDVILYKADGSAVWIDYRAFGKDRLVQLCDALTVSNFDFSIL